MAVMLVALGGIFYWLIMHVFARHYLAKVEQYKIRAWSPNDIHEMIDTFAVSNGLKRKLHKSAEQADSK